MGSRFIQVLQKDIVTNPEEWKDAGPGKFINLSNKAKNVYCVLSVIAYSQAGNAKGLVAQGGLMLGSDWFWTSHSILRQLTGSADKTVQRGIKELKDKGLIGYYPAKNQSQKCFFKIKRIKYKAEQNSVRDVRFKSKAVEKENLNSPPKYSAYQKGGVVFKSGKDTHNEEGKPIDMEGNCVDPRIFNGLMRKLKEGEKGERLFLNSVLIQKLENHLSPEYREKLEIHKIEEQKKEPDEIPF